MADSQPIISAVLYKEIAGFHGYYRAGDDGSVWTRLIRGSNFGRLGEWRRMKLLPIRGTGRLKVALRRDGRTIWIAVPRLILETFVGPCPEGMEACHRDDNPANNRLENLRWDTHVSNCEDRSRNGAAAGKYRKVIARNQARESRRAMVREIRKLRTAGLTYLSISEKIGMSVDTVYRVITGKTYKTVS